MCNTCVYYDWYGLAKWCKAWDADIGSMWAEGCDQYVDAYAKTHIYLNGKRHKIEGGTT